MSLPEALTALSATWKNEDGLPMIDYSCQAPGKRPGSHGESIDLREFRKFLKLSRPFDFDLMLEIKDKERSALAALRAAGADPRLETGRNQAEG
jgi:UV DNA damage endonuclease